MAGWLESLPINPLPALSDETQPPLLYFVCQDLLEQPVGSAQVLWHSPAALKILRKQDEDGSWCYPGASRKTDSCFNYSLLETYRNLRILIEMHAFNRQHRAIAAAAEYVFSCQTEQGDIRGILGNQYMPYYHAALLELLIKAGYEQDQRTQRGIAWLLSMRQHDGGWIVPLQAVPASQKTTQIWSAEPIPPAREKPFSHMATGMVLRGFAAHPTYAHSEAAWHAANLLKGRFFRADKYNDRQGQAYWLKFEYPFWWNNLLSALDTLSRLGFSAQDEQVQSGIHWFQKHQEADGLWPTKYDSGKNAPLNRLWVGLAVCRMLKSFAKVSS